MASLPSLGLQDFERLAGVMDRYLPLIAPVGEAILDRLPPLDAEAAVLDVACGTGEPGLTLLRRSPSIRLLGVDGAPTMIEIARSKAAREGLSRARFEVMTAEHLACGEGALDAVVSRFGLLMFGDTLAGARELRRVLGVGGAFSLAVWDDMATNNVVRTVIAALRPLVPAELISPFENALGARAGEQLREVGWGDAQTDTFRWNYPFANDAALWEFVSGPGLFARHFAALTEADLPRVREQVLGELAAHRQGDGSYRIPHACRLWWGQR
jgi:SAM-dependent methyltransferase